MQAEQSVSDQAVGVKPISSKQGWFISVNYYLFWTFPTENIE